MQTLHLINVALLVVFVVISGASLAVKLDPAQEHKSDLSKIINAVLTLGVLVVGSWLWKMPVWVQLLVTVFLLLFIALDYDTLKLDIIYLRKRKVYLAIMKDVRQERAAQAAREAAHLKAARGEDRAA
ncbi:hypothetical protein SAMN05216466_10696 [Paraburkholderia phenazinium]|uniref:Uncharacterized protein n=1 Tax=Paraburkholderia phenazinium TaxID=60549 RepID=A0A1G7Y9Q2_9BURK|nr:hypothetical protein [Paraburkholderia phenazinium]SDG93155.1 hypothetical protein SAMN05216466_10696 [Paraburkholderia phenazinium]